MLTRSGVARRLGKSIATVRRMEGVELHPVRDQSGILRFGEAELERVVRSKATRSSRPQEIESRRERLEARPTRERPAPNDRYQGEVTALRKRLELVEVTARDTAEALAAERMMFARVRLEAAHPTARLAHSGEEAGQRSAALMALQLELTELLESLSSRELRRLDPETLDQLLALLDEIG